MSLLYPSFNNDHRITHTGYYPVALGEILFIGICTAAEISK